MSRKKPKPLRDRVDGYELKHADAEKDPWRAKDLARQMKAHADAARKEGRLDSAEAYDGFVNTLTGIGDWTRDKALGGARGGLDFQVNLMSGIAAQNRWRGSDLGARVVETIPDEMTREGWDVSIQPDEDDEGDDKQDAFGQPDPTAPPPAMPPRQQNVRPLEIDDEGAQMVEAVCGRLDELGALDVVQEALSYERAYGGSAIFVGADDGMDDLAKPLDEDRIKDIGHLTAWTGGWDGEAVAWSYYRDVAGPKYGQPETYMVRNIGVPIAKIPAPGEPIRTSDILPPSHGSGSSPMITWVHESRLLVFPGTAVSRLARVQMRGWGDSIFTRCDEVLQQYNQTWGGIANLMTDFSQGVMSIEGFAQALMANNRNGMQNVTKRALAVNMTRSISRMMFIDSKEKFDRSTVPLTGVPEVLQQFALRLAAAADMPVALLMGQAPAGLNATGASDIRFFYDRVASRQKKRMMPQLRRLLHLLMIAKEGPTDGKEPKKWSVKARPLYQLSALERADLRLKVTQADQIAIETQQVTPEEVAAKRYGGSEFDDGSIQLDLEGREEMAAQDEADRVAAAKVQEKVAIEAAKVKAAQPKPGDSAPDGGVVPEEPGADEPGKAK